MTIKGGSTIDQSSAERRNPGTTPKSSPASCAAISAGIELVGLARKRRSGAGSGLR